MPGGVDAAIDGLEAQLAHARRDLLDAEPSVEQRSTGHDAVARELGDHDVRVELCPYGTQGAPEGELAPALAAEAVPPLIERAQRAIAVVRGYLPKGSSPG